MRIDAAREANPDDFMLRVDPPRNPYRGEREFIVAAVEHQLKDSFVVAWHCTRICPDEAEAVRSAGMFLLSPETFDDRVQRRLDAGDITASIANQLRAKNQAREKNRRDQLWFVLTRSLLATSGVDDLFRFWGGEALYNSHDRNPLVGPILSALGTPCIVELAVPCVSITSYVGLGTTIVRIFELANGLHDENQADCEGYTRTPRQRRPSAEGHL